jgi:hypothetical protein
VSRKDFLNFSVYSFCRPKTFSDKFKRAKAAGTINRNLYKSKCPVKVLLN